MAKVEDILKRAVETEDWLLACSLYTQITGKPLSPPSLLELDADFEHEIPEEESCYKTGDIVLYQSPSGKKPRECEVLEVIDSGGFESYVIKMKQNGRKYTVNVEEISVDASKEETAETPIEEPETDEPENFVVSTHNKQNDPSNDTSGTQMKSQPISAPKTRKYIGVSNNPFEDTLTDGLVDENGNSLLQTEAERASRRVPVRGKRSALITVECSICEKTLSVAPALAIGYVKDRPGTTMSEKQNTYKCNNCNSRKGRAQQVRDNHENQSVRRRSE